MPRCDIKSSISRWLRLNRWYRHTAYWMISGANQCRLYIVALFICGIVAEPCLPCQYPFMVLILVFSDVWRLIWSPSPWMFQITLKLLACLFRGNTSHSGPGFTSFKSDSALNSFATALTIVNLIFIARVWCTYNNTKPARRHSLKYLQNSLIDINKKYADQQEFIQAVEEVAADVGSLFENNKHYE